MDNELRYFLEQGPTTVKELARLTGKSASTIYKALEREEGVIKTKGKDEAARFHRIPEVIHSAAAPLDGERDTAATESTPAPTEGDAVAPAPTPGAGKRGRKATGAGKRLTATTSDNPRRKASHGYRSLQIIIDNPSITTEDYLAKGGRLNDLRWDIAHGHVKVEG